MALWDDAKKRDIPIMRIRQTGPASEYDSRQSVTEMIRRIKDEDEPEPERESVYAKPRTRTITSDPPDPAAIIDRFHKSADQYITVAKPHEITSDPVRLPGEFETWQEAIDHAVDNIIPNFTGNERVAIEGHGGLYEEDILLTSDRIDLFGIGMPKIVGTLTIDTSTLGAFSGNRSCIAGIDFDGVAATAIDLSAFAPLPAGPGAAAWRPFFIDCNIHSEITAFRTLGRIKAFHCRFWVDEDGAYGNLLTPAVQVGMGGHVYWSEFYHCIIKGAVDDRAMVPPAGFPNTGMAWHTVAKNAFADPVYLGYTGSGVIFRHCTIDGWGFNECWRVVHEFCKCYGGYVPGALTGETYCYNAGDSSLLIRGKVYFDHTEVACRYLVEEEDMTLGVAAATTDTYLRHFDHLSNGSSYLGALIVGGTDPIVTGTAIQGVCYGKISATWREWFMANGVPAEIAMLVNCDSDTAHYAANGFAFPAAGAIQPIFENPYRDGGI